MSSSAVFIPTKKIFNFPNFSELQSQVMQLQADNHVLMEPAEGHREFGVYLWGLPSLWLHVEFK